MEYPRPQLNRNSFFSLNGVWQLNDLSINIPYPPQAPLSNYHGIINDTLVYQKDFILPIDFYHANNQVLLHFGAVDQLTKVYVNNRYIGSHSGGYLPFYFDISSSLNDGVNKLVMKVTDSLSHDYPYGKQSRESHGMWYTQVSGIWQTVWVEAVSKNCIKDLLITPSLTGINLKVNTEASRYTVTIENNDFKKTYTAKDTDITIDNPHYWTPDDPYLYTFSITTDDDYIESYFALRTVEIKKHQILLNDTPIFLHGILDQGYYHDGLFLPEHPDFYKTEIMNIKKLGFNLIRKHIKIEPELFYYNCDKLGILVMQDMVNNGEYRFIHDTVLPTLGFINFKDTRYKNTLQQNIFKQHMIDTISHLYNHPSIISYTIFNEGWGQFNSDEMYQICKELDPTRFYDTTSGWFSQKNSDVVSRHIYFRNKILSTNLERPLLLSECGGYTRPINNHLNSNKKQYGYGKTNSEKELTDKIEKMYQEMVIPSINNGLCGCIYTQISDIENEINGLYTYDRKICKVNQQRMSELARKLYSYYEKKSGLS